jgi:sarcosine oxidase gamma subunit
MADGNVWSPFGLIGNRLPVVSADFNVRALQSPFAYLIQGEPGNTAWTSAIATALGLSCPTPVGTVARNANGRRLICLGPDMWLCMSLDAVESDL